MLFTVGFTLIFVLVVCMLVRDGKAFFSDVLKLILLLVVALFALLAYTPFGRGLGR